MAKEAAELDAAMEADKKRKDEELAREKHCKKLRYN